MNNKNTTTTTTTTTTTKPAAIDYQRDRYYEDRIYDFRVEIPTGWVASNTSETSFRSPGPLSEEERIRVLEATGGASIKVAELCPRHMATSITGVRDAVGCGPGGFASNSEPDLPYNIELRIEQYEFNTEHMQERFASIIESGGNVTTDNLLVIEMKSDVEPEEDVFGMTGLSRENYEVVNETDTTTNLEDVDSGMVVSSNIPVKIVEYNSLIGREEEEEEPVTRYMLLTVFNAPVSNEVRAYKMFISSSSLDEPTTMTIPEVQRIFESFELLTK